MEMTKICKDCRIEQPISHYRDEKYNTCKKCANERDKILKKKARAKRLETMTVCELCEQTKTLREFAKLKKYYKQKICQLCYPTFATSQKIEWCKQEHNRNPNYRIKKSIAARLRTVLSKTDTTMNYIGCNVPFLREWFEFNFTEEMSWDNYGSYWSIDHVIPVKNFDLTNQEEALLCWNWTNLIPVTVAFNSSKKTVDLEKVDNVIQQLEKFKEKGSTTKWFSEKFTLNKEYVLQTHVNSS